MSIEASILDTANGSPLGLRALIENLKTNPTETYEALADFLFSEDALKHHTADQLTQVSKCLALLNEPECPFKVTFNWDYALKSGDTFLTKLCRMAYSDIPKLRYVVSLLLKFPLVCGNWSYAPNNGGTAFFWAMVCAHEDTPAISGVLDTVMARSDFEWNAAIKKEFNQDETPLYWFASACYRGLKPAIKALPKLAVRNDLAWLKTAKDMPHKNGTSPLSLLFNIASFYKEVEENLHIILDKLFDTDPNMPTYLDDLMHHKNNAKDQAVIKAFIKKNRERCYSKKHPLMSISHTNNALEAFYVRLKQAGQQPISKRLLDQITLSIRNDQLDFMLPGSLPELSTTGFDKTEIHRHLRSLKPGETYCIPKRYWGLHRSMTVLRTHEGEYQLILETKSKLPGHTDAHPQKTDSYTRNGSSKEGKVAWRIDQGEVKYFHLILKSNSLSSHEEFEQEIALSQTLGKHTKHILLYQQGVSRHKGDTQQRSAYALGAKGTLSEMHAAIKAATVEEKYTHIKDLLKACQIFHQNRYCHRDLSCNNILFMNINNAPYLTFSDYGTAKKVGSLKVKPRTTYGYESPEISAGTSTWATTDNDKYKYYHQQESKYHSFAHEIWKNQPGNIENHDITVVNPADDLWAIGINAYKILHNNNSPTLKDIANINADPLLRGLLAVKRSERIDIETALHLCNQKLDSLKPQIAIISALPTLTTAYDEKQRLLNPKPIGPSNNISQDSDNARRSMNTKDCLLLPLQRLMRSCHF